MHSSKVSQAPNADAAAGRASGGGWCGEEAFDDVGCLAVAGLQEVGVDVEGCRGVGVAQPAADGAHRHPCREKLGCVEVA